MRDSITNDMQEEARRHLRRNGFYRMPDGSYIPAHLAQDPKNPQRVLTPEEIHDRLMRKYKPN